jgi:hypothetical protein
MSDDDARYHQVRDQAQAAANLTGFDYGVEKLGNTWRYFMLPKKQNRTGYELRCEVVSAEQINHQRPGHGTK